MVKSKTVNSCKMASSILMEFSFRNDVTNIVNDVIRKIKSRKTYKN